MITGADNHLKWLCAVLNSNVASWLVRKTAPTSGAGATRWKKAYMEALPIPWPSEEQLRQADVLVESVRRLTPTPLLRSQAASDRASKIRRIHLRLRRVVLESYGLKEHVNVEHGSLV